MVGSILGFFIGVWVATRYYLLVYSWLTWMFFSKANVGKIVCFILTLVVVSRLIALLFWFIEKAFKLLSIVPFTAMINKVAGAIFGLAEGAFTVGTIIYVASRYSAVNTFLGGQLVNSKVSPWLLKLVDLLVPLYPEALKIIKSVIS